MKKILSIMLGLGLLLSTVPLFGEDTAKDTTKKTTKTHKKHKNTKKTSDNMK